MASERANWVLEALAEYELPLVRFALRLLGDEAAARDAVQHAFLRLCDRSVEHRERVGAWLYAVVRNRAMDLLRERGRTEPLAADAAIADERWAEEPLCLLERDELHSLLRRLVDALPLSQREAVVLWSDGFSYAEIASITGRAEGSLRVLVHRAIATLRAHPALKESTPRESAIAKTGQAGI
jgi:RNA polymerase sigma-70 factor (ECF subfamily)